MGQPDRRPCMEKARAGVVLPSLFVRIPKALCGEKSSDNVGFAGMLLSTLALYGAGTFQL
mgnify:CR=1